MLKEQSVEESGLISKLSPKKIDKKVVSKSKVSKKVDASKKQNQNPAQQSMSGVKWTSGNPGACSPR
jgi:hypothetical protein